MLKEKSQKAITFLNTFSGNTKLLFFSAFILILNLMDFLFFKKSTLAIHYERPFNLYGNLSVGSNLFEFVKRLPGDSWVDIGGSAFQTNLISFVIKNSQSFFWTDLIAGGNGVIEDFTFQPFSFVNFISTVFSPSLVSNHISFLIIFGLAFIFLAKYFYQIKNYTVISSLFGATFYFFNGFVTSGWSNSVVLPYIFLPIVLFKCSKYLNNPKSIISTTLIVALFLLNSFLPVVILCILGLNLIIISDHILLKRYEVIKRILKLNIIITLGLLISTFNYLPALSEIYNSGSLADYNNKVNDFYIPINSLFLFMGPLHYWHNFNELYKDNIELYNYGGFSVPYIGICGLFLLFYSILLFKKNNYILLFALIFILLRCFSPLAFYIHYLPILRSISYPYLFSLIMLIVAVLIPSGVESIIRNFSKKIAIFVLILLIIIECRYYFIAKEDSYFSIEQIFNYSIIFSLLIFSIINIKNNLRAYIFIILFMVEFFYMQNHNKIEFKELNNIQQRPAIQNLLKDSDIKDYRILSTGFDLIPPNLSSALNLFDISSLGHLSLDSKYNKFYQEKLGSDSSDYPIHGFTNCQNLKFNQQALDDLSVKFVITDKGNCNTVFFNKLPVLYEDKDTFIFINNTATPIVSFSGEKPQNCLIEVQKNQFSREYKINDCSGKLNIRLNFKADFKFYLNEIRVTPQEIYPFGKEFIVNEYDIIKVEYSSIYKISSLLSLGFVLILLFIGYRRNKNV